ncbi:MAG: hypothetical protein JXR46_02790 [Calditrichaceae bacterium]|nr:hypothetical protein [Calditrichaceae bacterium]MBN2707950.1 hypothetical protein [Calditrichaceae bacterium]RQV95948.1 MAG: hypothetical protein EH224_06165 [Calditrichota bacterium]
MDDRQKDKLYEVLPLLTFAAAYFIVQLFDFMETTYFLIAVIVSLLTFMSMGSLFKTDYQTKENQLRTLSFYNGALTVAAFLFFLQSFLHWYRNVSMSYRTMIMLFILLIYAVLLFRAMRILGEFKRTTPRK